MSVNIQARRFIRSKIRSSYGDELLGSKVFHRVDGGGPECLEAYRCQGDQQRQQASCNKDPSADGDTIDILHQPLIHKIRGNGTVTIASLLKPMEVLPK